MVVALLVAAANQHAVAGGWLDGTKKLVCDRLKLDSCQVVETAQNYRDNGSEVSDAAKDMTGSKTKVGDLPNIVIGMSVQVLAEKGITHESIPAGCNGPAMKVLKDLLGKKTAPAEVIKAGAQLSQSVIGVLPVLAKQDCMNAIAIKENLGGLSDSVVAKACRWTPREWTQKEWALAREFANVSIGVAEKAIGECARGK